MTSDKPLGLPVSPWRGGSLARALWAAACSLQWGRTITLARVSTLLFRLQRLRIYDDVQWNPVSIPTDPHGEQQTQNTKDGACRLVTAPCARHKGRRKDCYARYHTGNRY